MKICIVGPPGCGKTTLAREVVKVLGMKYKVDSEVVEEFARHYIRDCYDGSDVITDPFHQYPVVLGQIEAEKKVESVHHVTVCDSSVVLGYAYTLILKNRLPQDIKNKPVYGKVIEGIGKIIFDHLPTYDHIFVLNSFAKVDRDKIRHYEQREMDQVSDITLHLLALKEVNYIELTGTLEENVRCITDVVLEGLC